MRIKFFILLILFFWTNLVLSQNKKREIINYLKKEMEIKKIPGCQLVVLKENKIILSEALGIASLSFSIPV